MNATAPSLREAERTAVPERIASRYRVERLLGQGGMGAVYAVVDGVTGQRVALKRLLADSASKSAQLFEREYQTLAGLRHPSIVRVFDYGRDEAAAYYTMELIEGGDLSKQAPMPWRDACACLRDAASILGVLHARKLVHRDLSPRNLLRTASGKLKLIDFGALAPFGTATEIVGTPPFVPPEALERGVLDQRSDLFALGALGYWLVTGAHAFPARALKDLARLWERTPATPSSLVALLDEKPLPPVPPALDDLLAALLRVSPSERPANTNELIDRLNDIADLEPESQDHAIDGYLNSKILVGRTREHDRVLSCIREAAAGHGQALVLEGEPGVGRSRFLAEVAVTARLSGLATLSIDGSHGDKPYAAANALCLSALSTLGEQVEAIVVPHAPVLGRLSTELHAALGGGPLTPSSGVPGEDRAHAQNALKELFLALSRRQLLALLVDDLQTIDEESQGLFAALAHEVDAHPLLIVAAASYLEGKEPSAAVLSFRSVSARVHLLPLTADETLELLRSVFGVAPYLERLAERLHRASGGYPGYCLELLEHLVRSGRARYDGGTWVLPAELSASDLPSSRQASYLARLERISSEARVLARLLSVPHHGAFSEEQCIAVSEQAPARALALLGELVREQVLLQSRVGYRFAHPELQEALAPELASFERANVHRILGTTTLAHAGSSTDERLRAAVHFLRADEPRRAYPLILAAADTFTGAELNSALRVAAPLFEEIHELLVARGADDHARAEPLAMLSLAGYFIDRRYAASYGAKTIAVLSRLLKLRLANTLARFLGRKAGLIITLIIAGVSLRLHSRRGPTLPTAIRRLLSAASALAGTAACCIDPRGAARLAKVIEPLTIFGADHAAGIVHRFTLALSLVVQDRLSFTNKELRSLIARLESDVPIKALDDGIRLNYIAGCYLSLGVNEAWREGTEVLRIADRLEKFSPLYAMSADHLRESYYGREGDVERAEQSRQRVEVHAVQLGSAWQVETWAPAHLTEVALRTHDAMIMKRSVQELTRLIQDIPSLAIDERHARGTYLVLRGKYAEAIPLLDDDEEPLSTVGWVRTRGTLARAHNKLGQHARAREICLQAISHCTDEDLLYAAMNLSIQIELVFAHAGLHDFEAAHALLVSLRAAFGSNSSPLTLGMIHEAHLGVALAQRDWPAARAQLEQLVAQYRPTGIASLQQFLVATAREVERAEHPNQAPVAPGPRLLDDASHLMTRVQLVLGHHAGNELSERANKGLQIALELSSADDGFIVLQGSDGGMEVYLGSPPSRELVKWARGQLHAASVDAQTAMTEEVDSQIDSNYMVEGRMRCCAAVLSTQQQGQDAVVGVLVLGFHGRVPRMPVHQVLSMIGDHVAR